ncbi:MAG: ribonuclease PH [Candidatus Fermentibacteraceae bacterium]|nr:ribonuclease PH [Candidatus Fermentibacteraceae bacterium]MBN2608212.1 ribonuclease PH [Candidatus Fermentibacteraceae bacterium]
MRADGRLSEDLREIEIETGYQPLPDGSALISWGETRVLCSATVEYRVPFFLTGQGTGWVTAEYSMLPGSGNRRVKRERTGARGRTQEIERLIGRSLRQSLDLGRIGERTITVDCDVLVADGGTRVASIVGGAVALRLAIKRQLVEGRMKDDPFRGYVGALSLGLVEDEILLDLCYEEDSRAAVDMNVVASESGEIVELQATAENGTVPMRTVVSMGEMALAAIAEIVVPLQREASGE